MIICKVVLLLSLVCRSADAAAIAYNTTCTPGTDTCGTGQTCKVDANTTKCLCDTTNHWVVNSSHTGCQCDSAHHWTASGTGNACECSTGYTGATCKANIGTACTTTADCDTTTTTTAVCDVLATPAVCKIQGTGNCTGRTNQCVSNATCTNNVCVCTAKYTTNTDKLCGTVLGSTCNAAADCNTTVPHSDCFGGKTCTCITGYTVKGTDCKAGLNTTCAATTDCDTVTTADAVCDLNAASKICSVGSGGDCTHAKCVSHATCTSNVCTCDTGYTTTTSKLCVESNGNMNILSLAITLASVFGVYIL